MSNHPPGLTPETATPANAETPDTLTDETPTGDRLTPGYSRVSPAQATEMVRLRRINPKITLEQIAAAVGVKSLSTVSHWIRELDNDTVQEARKFVKTKALKAVMKLDEQLETSADPRVVQGAAKAIAALGGVVQTGQPIQVGVQVVVGSMDAPAGHDPLDNVTIDAIPATDR
jgi:transposase-like protein